MKYDKFNKYELPTINNLNPIGCDNLIIAIKLLLVEDYVYNKLHQIDINNIYKYTTKNRLEDLRLLESEGKIWFGIDWTTIKESLDKQTAEIYERGKYLKFKSIKIRFNTEEEKEKIKRIKEGIKDE